MFSNDVDYVPRERPRARKLVPDAVDLTPVNGAPFAGG